MKICPACQNQYTDDTLQFCLQDGTPLTFARQADTPTVVLNGIDEVTALRGRSQARQSEVTYDATAMPTTARRSRMPAIVVAIVITLFVVFTAAVIGLVLYRNFSASGNSSVTKGEYDRSSQPNSFASTQPTRVTRGFTAPTSFATPAAASSPPVVNDVQIRNEVSQTIYSWKSLTESKNMSELRSIYAPVLDFYYTKRNVNVESVIDDKERAFSKYTSIRIDLTIKSITTYPSVNTATAIIEKDWTFEGEDPFCGVIRSEMGLRKVSGAWLIVGERDVRRRFRRTC